MVKRAGLVIFCMGTVIGATGDSTRGTLRGGAYYPLESEMETVLFQEVGGPVQLTQLRSVAHVPPEYGKLFAITGQDPVVFWYEGEDGTVRNIIVRSSVLTVLVRKGRRSSP